MMMQNLLRYLPHYHGPAIEKNFNSECISNNIGVNWDPEQKCDISDVEKNMGDDEDNEDLILLHS